MPIPDIPNFQMLLETLTLNEPEDIQNYESLLIVNKSFGRDLDKSVQFPEIKLWYKHSTELSVDALLAKVQKELNENNHPDSLILSKILLSVATLHTNFQTEPINCLNKIVQHITTSKLNQIFVFPRIQPLEEDFSITSFHIGSFLFCGLNIRNFQKLCRKVGSDYYDKYSKELENRFVIERFEMSVNLFNFTDPHNFLLFPVFSDKLPDNSPFLPKMAMLDRLMSEYFHYISNHYKEEFWSLLLQEQHLNIAYKDSFIDPELIKLIDNSGFITVYSDIAGKEWSGWVEPILMKPIFDFGKSDIKIPQVVKSLKNDFNFTNFTDSEIHQTIKTYSLFMSKAKRHNIKNNPDESFLHYIIALDLLLGNKNASTKSVADRSAVLVHRRFSKSFEDQRKEMNNLYDIRSKYVHAGKHIEPQYIEKIEVICKEVLQCFLRLQMVEENHSDGFIDKWIKNLDFLVKAIEAEKKQDKSDYTENGIWYD